MRSEIEEATAALVGLPLTALGRAATVVAVHFGEAPAWVLQVSCTWRLASADDVLTGAGDLFTPADPELDPDDFAWEEAGTSWFDVRARAFLEATASAPARVEAVAGDALGGLRLQLAGGLALELFPESSAAEHVETEFWRLVRPQGAEPPFVVTSNGARYGDEG